MTMTFKEYLQEDLVRRCQSNSSYSLRAYARFLRIEPSALSKILNGKRQITQATFLKLAERLALSPADVEKLQPPPLRRARGSKNAESRVTYREISIDAFEAIADWYHFALLELTSVDGFRPDARWVARKLGITPSEVNIAVERLQRLGLLEIGEDGSWRDVSSSATVYRDNFTNRAFRNLQAQVLRKALEALENIDINEREQSAMTMAIDSRRLPEAKQRIKEFRRGLCDFLQRGTDTKLDSVYHLSLSLYPVTTQETFS